MILNRICAPIEPHLRFNQNGFREGRSTVSHILALRRILEEVRKNNLTAVITLLDFRKAFDSIQRNKMFSILKAYGIPPRLLTAIRTMYTNTRARVVTADGTSNEFQITTGVMQGNTLAPFLFVVVLDYALRAAISGKEEELGFTLQPRRSRRHPAKVLTDLDYADDIAFLSENISQAQDLVVCVERECSKIGLAVNEVKTKVMTCNAATSPPLHMQSGASLESVVDFKYLGSWVNSFYQDIKTRKALAWKALNGMKSIWKSNISREIKIRFFRATVESILLYGCESWALNVSIEKSLDGCYTRMLRAAMNID